MFFKKPNIELKAKILTKDKIFFLVTNCGERAAKNLNLEIKCIRKENNEPCHPLPLQLDEMPHVSMFASGDFYCQLTLSYTDNFYCPSFLIKLPLFGRTVCKEMKFTLDDILGEHTGDAIIRIQ
jgi:hypothetical protein